MSNEKFASVWDAIEDTPEEAENMKLRSGLMMALKAHLACIGRGCKNFCVNGQLAGNCCTPMELQINDRNERTDRQPAG